MYCYNPPHRLHLDTKRLDTKDAYGRLRADSERAHETGSPSRVTVAPRGGKLSDDERLAHEQLSPEARGRVSASPTTRRDMDGVPTASHLELGRLDVVTLDLQTKGFETVVPAFRLAPGQPDAVADARERAIQAGLNAHLSSPTRISAK